MNESVAIVTAGNDAYFSLLDNLLASLEAAALPSNFKICVFGLGLSPEQRSNIEQRRHHLATLRWSLDFPNREQTEIGLQVMYERPFLPAYFPDFHTYLWIDADTWVQDRSALFDYVNGAVDGRIALVPEQFPAAMAYRAVSGNQTVRRFVIAEKTIRDHVQDCYRSCFGASKAHYAFGPLANTGILGLRGDSGIWKTWQKYLSDGLRGGHMHRLAEQQAMNLAIQENAVEVNRLPARCNWNLTTHHPVLDIDHGLLVDSADNAPLGIIHLTDLKIYQSLMLPMVGGGIARVPLRYRDFIAKVKLGSQALRADDFQSTAVESIVEV